ncbi:hypothetical protein MMC13_003014 [Lambiella insularis]|nr:hypothetical protein [Lambiella insularis]
MSARSFVAGDSRALATLPCRHWAAEPNERWEGDFASVRLNLPVLLIGNRYDPETPLDSARRLAEEMGPNAALVEQRSYGHCSISAVSSCTFGVVLHYLLDGIVPDVGKVCEVDDVDYGDYFPREGRALSLSKYTRLAEMVVEELGEQL